jgi:hypothetical protein
MKTWTKAAILVAAVAYGVKIGKAKANRAIVLDDTQRNYDRMFVGIVEYYDK